MISERVVQMRQVGRDSLSDVCHGSDKFYLCQHEITAFVCIVFAFSLD